MSKRYIILGLAGFVIAVSHGAPLWGFEGLATRPVKIVPGLTIQEGPARPEPGIATKPVDDAVEPVISAKPVDDGVEPVIATMPVDDGVEPEVAIGIAPITPGIAVGPSLGEPVPGDSNPTPDDPAPAPGDSDPGADDPIPSPGDSDTATNDPAPTPGDAIPGPGDSAPTAGDSIPTPVDSAPSGEGEAGLPPPRELIPSETGDVTRGGSITEAPVSREQTPEVTTGEGEAGMPVMVMVGGGCSLVRR